MVAKFELPVWIREGKEVNKLADAFGSFWDKTEAWIKTPLNQLDAETCHVYVLKLLAYQNDIDRFANEPDELFRKRVKHGVKNAIDAASKEGFLSIFERLDIGYLEIEERTDNINWDMVSLKISDSQLSTNTNLLDNIIRQYGRTCRRYELTVSTSLNFGITANEFGNDWSLDIAKEVIELWEANANIKNMEIGHNWSLDAAGI